MSVAPEFPRRAKAEVFACLAQGRPPGVTVVTPNRRLAQELTREFDQRQIARGLKAWQAADIFPFAAFLERWWEDALYSDLGAALPHLLTPAQEQALWEEIIAASSWGDGLLTLARTAAQCRDAWRLAHAWRIDGALGKFPGNEDARAFVEWAHGYAKRTAGDTDAARLPDVVAPLLRGDALAKPGLLVAYAFDILPPQSADYFRACLTHGVEVCFCEPERRETVPLRAPYPSPRHELEAAAKWARARLETAHARGAKEGNTAYPRIGVVVPDLEQRRKEVIRVFSRIMEPGWNLPGTERKPLPFNVTLGVPLTDYPLVHAALGLLGLAHGEVDFAAASRLVRSPFIGGAETEMTHRAQLDAELRKRLPARLTLASLVGSTGQCPLLRARLEALYGYAVQHLAGTQSPHDWARHFSALLEAVGFGGERALDTDEFQTLSKWYEVLGEFARLARVTPRMSSAQALAALRRLCADVLFQPESGEPSVQVLGVLESAGLTFDHLWVSGLTDDAWPLPARPNPFIPVALQKKAGIPEAAADTALALDRRITQDWMGAADEVILSHPLRDQERELLPSPLIASVPEGTVEIPDFPRYRDLLFASRVLESVLDGVAPRFDATEVRGGTRVLADQAACPFRAFARHRLAAAGLEQPTDGLDARDRGTLLHTLMAGIWGEIKTKARYDSMEPGELAAVIARAAELAVSRVHEQRPGVLEGRYAELERERLAKLAREWLEVERGRAAFEVVACEEKRVLEVAGLTFTGRIDRMDRLLEGDAAGSYALLDYKSGRATPKDWLDERPDDPQLPLYAIRAQENIGAVAYARIKTGEMRFAGLARRTALLPKVRKAESWDALFEQWRRRLTALGNEFIAGEARVAPKRALNTCRYCDLQPLCRVHERLAALEDDEEEE